MKTSKPFATISYNSEKYLVSKLDDLIKRDAISFYAFVLHYAEEDEKKDHRHLYIVPNGQIETNAVRKVLEEFDITHPDKPLGCLDCVSSKFGDWYLYVCHDSAYLATKGQTRKHHYTKDNFIVSSEESFTEKITTIDYTKFRKTQDFVDAVLNGTSFYEMVVRGQVPAPQFVQWKQLYDYIYCSTFRNGRETHTPDQEVDPETGEVLEN